MLVGFGRSVDRSTLKNVSADENRIERDRQRETQEKTLDAKVTKLSNEIHANGK